MRNKFTIDSTTQEIIGKYSLGNIHANKLKLGQAPEQETHANFFVQEEMGVLVYDSRAIIKTEPSKSHTKKVPQTETEEPKVKAQVSPYPYDEWLFSKMTTKKEEYVLVVPKFRTLKFDSNFESGNLRKAVKISEDEYSLKLEFDSNTKGHTQWFFFSVYPYKPAHTVRFHIENLLKPGTLYKEGFKPFVYVRDKWSNDVQEVTYMYDNSKYYTLSFKYTFQTDLVYFAYCYPYTTYDLKKDVNKYITMHPEYLRIDTLCTTLLGKECISLTITNNVHTYTPWTQEWTELNKTAAARRLLRIKLIKAHKKRPHNAKKVVFVTGRVHPGETVGSFIVKGFLDFILSDSREAKLLRNRFIFKVIPMLNPDGVFLGNSRCSALGVDLNRRWMHPSKSLHPTIYYTKKLITMLGEDREIVAFCDMHGHSLKKTAFIYGNAIRSYDLVQLEKNLLAKLVPYLLSKNNPIFSMNDSKFRMEKEKEHTARIVLYKENNIVNSYTLESSFYGPNFQMRVPDLLRIGKDFARTLCVFMNNRVFRSKLRELWDILRAKRLNIKPPVVVEEQEEMAESDEEACFDDLDQEFDMEELRDIGSGIDSESAGSDSEPSDKEEYDKLAITNHKQSKISENPPAKSIRSDRYSHKIKETPKQSSDTKKVNHVPAVDNSIQKIRFINSLVPIGSRVTNILSFASPPRTHKKNEIEKKSDNSFRGTHAIYSVKNKFYHPNPLPEPSFKTPRIRVTNTSGGFRNASEVKYNKNPNKKATTLSSYMRSISPKDASHSREITKLFTSITKVINF